MYSTFTVHTCIAAYGRSLKYQHTLYMYITCTFVPVWLWIALLALDEHVTRCAVRKLFWWFTITCADATCVKDEQRVRQREDTSVPRQCRPSMVTADRYPFNEIRIQNASSSDKTYSSILTICLVPFFLLDKNVWFLYFLKGGCPKTYQW